MSCQSTGDSKEQSITESAQDEAETLDKSVVNSPSSPKHLINNNNNNNINNINNINNTVNSNNTINSNNCGSNGALSENSGSINAAATSNNTRVCHSRGPSSVSACIVSGKDLCHSRGASTDGSIMDNYTSSATESRRGTYSEAGTLPIGTMPEGEVLTPFKD